MKTVLITGVSRGIGKALAQRFLAEGYMVIGASETGSVDYSAVNLKVLELDLTSDNSINKCAEQIAKQNPKIDILVNCAGVLKDNDDTKLVIEKLRETLEVNVIGTADFTEHVVAMMNKGGHIVNVSSQAGSLEDIEAFTHTHAPLRYPAYKISKCALNMYTRTLALRLKYEDERGIVVSSIHPGWVRTDMGGDEAPTTPEEAANDIYELAISHPETGQFWYKGKKYPW